MKTATANGVSGEKEYLPLIENAWREFKEIQNELRRQKMKTERAGVSSRRMMGETWKILRRVEATL